MARRAEIKVDLGHVHLGNQLLLANFHAGSDMVPCVAITASDGDTEETATLICDAIAYDEFKDLLAAAEETTGKLKRAATIMPSDVLPNSMRLDIDIGAVEASLGSGDVSLVLSVDRDRKISLGFNFTIDDEEEGGFVCLRVAGSDYKRMRHFLRECDDQLNELYANRRIAQRFLTQ